MIALYFLQQDAPPQPYAFSYDVVDEYGTKLLRQEQGDAQGNKQGSYGYIDAHGISRQVDYVADAQGFRAVVKTNEPGTESQNPADVEIISSAAPAAYSSPAVSAYAPQPSPYRPAVAVRQPIAVRQALPVAAAISATPGAYSAVGVQPVGVPVAVLPKSRVY